MKMLPCTLLLALSLSPAMAAADDDAADVQQRLAAWAAAWPAGDVDKMLAFYEDSDDVSAVISAGRSYKTTAGIRQMYALAFGDAAWEKVTLKNVVVRRAGNVAWATCRFEADITTNQTKTPLRFTSQGTLIFHKTDDAWRIAHEHFSPIIGVPRVQGREGS